MASQVREQPRDEELDKILNKAFDHIRKRVNALMVKREKKFLRDMKTTSKKPRENNRESHKEESKKNKNSDYHRSKSSSDSE